MYTIVLKRTEFKMNIILELLLIIVLSSFINIYSDAEQNSSTFPEEYGRTRKAHISKRNDVPFRTSFNYLQQDLSACNHCGLLGTQASQSGHRLIMYGDIVFPTNKYPWMVQLLATTEEDGHFLCGGAILNEFYILTAAHCILKSIDPNYTEPEFLHPDAITVSFVTDQYAVQRGPGFQYVIPHPDFSFHTLLNDIALMKLKEKITCDWYKNPICIPPSHTSIPVGKVFTVAGWGDTEDAPFSWELREGRIKYANFETCGEPAFMRESYLCFEELPERFQMSCHGDSGGPVFYEDNGKYYIIGVLHRLVCGNCQPGEKVLATSITKFKDWIEDAMEFFGRYHDELRV